MSGQDNRSGFGEFSATLLILGGGIASPIVIRLGHDRSDGIGWGHPLSGTKDWMGPPTLQDWMGPPTLRYQGNVDGTFRPNWLRSGRQTHLGGPGGAQADTAVPSMAMS